MRARRIIIGLIGSAIPMVEAASGAIAATCIGGVILFVAAVALKGLIAVDGGWGRRLCSESALSLNFFCSGVLGVDAWLSRSDLSSNA